MTDPQVEALRAIREFLNEEGFTTRVPIMWPSGDDGGQPSFRPMAFEVIRGNPVGQIVFEVSLIGDGVRLSQHERGRNGHLASVFFDLCNPRFFDQLVVALRGGYDSWDRAVVVFSHDGSPFFG